MQPARIRSRRTKTTSVDAPTPARETTRPARLDRRARRRDNARISAFVRALSAPPGGAA